MRQKRKFEALVMVAATCALPALLGAKGCFFGGEVLLGDNEGGANTGNTGSTASTGGSHAASTGGADSGGAIGALPMAEHDIADAAVTAWNIRPHWYWFTDQTDQTEGGVTTFEGVVDGVPPFVPGKGMCVHGTTGPGMADGYKTWGGGIGVNLNYDATTDNPLPLRDPPRCYTIVIAADATYPGEFRAEPLGKVPPGGQPLFWPIHAGVNDVCLDRIQVSTYCGAESTCLGPESLTDGVATLNITAASAAFQGGPIDFCVEAIIPHD